MVDWGDSVDSGGVIDFAEGAASGVVFGEVFCDDSPADAVDFSEDTDAGAVEGGAFIREGIAFDNADKADLDDTGGIEFSGDVAFISIFGKGREGGSVDSLVELFPSARGFEASFSTADWIPEVVAIFSAGVVSLPGLANAVPVLPVLAGMLPALMLSFAAFTVIWLCPAA